MENNIIETSIDELIEVLRKKEKMTISEAANSLKVTQKQLEQWIDVLEEKGIIELKYPIIGEPQIILKGTIPEKIEIKAEKKEIIKPKVESETANVSEKLKSVESKLDELSYEVDASILKEDLFEIMIIVAGLRDIERISFHLKDILKIIQQMKAKKLFNENDKEFIVTMMKEIAENWEEFGEEKIAKIFTDLKEKVESA
jgi:DNA-binding transcriptional ArsR family regulator